MVAIDTAYYLSLLFIQRDAIERHNSEDCAIQLLKACALADLVSFLADMEGGGGGLKFL